MGAVVSFLAEHMSWLPVGGSLLGAVGGFLPSWWRIAAIGAAILIVVGSILWVRADMASQRATIAEQQAGLVTLAAQRDQEAVTARRNAEALAAMRRVAEAEQAARQRQRQAYEAALQQRDKILDEVRREKTARDPAPGAFRPFFGGVR